MSTANPTRLAVWLEASRPKTMPASITPVVMGSAMAYGEGTFHPLSAVCALLGALFIQIGANYANDYADYLKGADTSGRLGPRRVTQSGLVKPETMRIATAIVFLLACVPGVFIIYRGGLPFVLIGLTSILFAVLYTAGPFPLGYVGLADLFVLVYFGPVALAGTYYLHALRLTPEAVIAGFSPGLLSTALLTINNLRDIEQDRKANKRTLAVRFGANFARIEYLGCVMLATTVIPLYLFLITNKRLLPAVALITSAYALRQVRAVLAGSSGKDLNIILAKTGKTLLFFGISFSLGWIT